ncbi:MAG: flavin reductase family protein [Gemmatimonadetes bacterium]|nr:flavin reductase family protein [Gemmatimonadota bacterium]
MTDQSPSRIAPELFRAVLGRFASGVTVVTTVDDEGRPHGMTVSAFSSLSLVPPLVLVCIGRDATLAPLLATRERMAVNLLALSQRELSQRFASKVPDRFDGVAHRIEEPGVPVLEGALGWLGCRIVARHPAGDHVIYVGEVATAGTAEGEPLAYYRGAYASVVSAPPTR